MLANLDTPTHVSMLQVTWTTRFMASAKTWTHTRAHTHKCARTPTCKLQPQHWPDHASPVIRHLPVEGNQGRSKTVDPQGKRFVGGLLLVQRLQHPVAFAYHHLHTAQPDHLMLAAFYSISASAEPHQGGCNKTQNIYQRTHLSQQQQHTERDVCPKQLFAF